MKFIDKASLPSEPVNTYIRKGIAGERIGEVFASIGPEIGYVTDKRGGPLHYRIAVSPENLQSAGLERYASA